METNEDDLFEAGIKVLNERTGRSHEFLVIEWKVTKGGKVVSQWKRLPKTNG